MNVSKAQLASVQSVVKKTHLRITSLIQAHNLAMNSATQAAEDATRKAEEHAKLDLSYCSHEAVQTSRKATLRAIEAQGEADKKLAEQAEELRITVDNANKLREEFDATLDRLAINDQDMVNVKAAAMEEDNKLKENVREVLGELQIQKTRFAEATVKATKAAIVKAAEVTRQIQAAAAANEAAVIKVGDEAEAKAAHEQKTQMEDSVLAQEAAVAAAVAENAKIAQAMAKDQAKVSAEATAEALALAKTAADVAAEALAAAEANAVQERTKLIGQKATAVAAAVAEAATAAKSTARDHASAQDYASAQAKVKAEALALATAKVNEATAALASAEAKVKASAAREIEIQNVAATLAEAASEASANAASEASANAAKDKENAWTGGWEAGFAEAKADAEKIALADVKEKARVDAEATAKTAEAERVTAELLRLTPKDERENISLTQLRKHAITADKITNADVTFFKKNWRLYYNKLLLAGAQTDDSMEKWIEYMPGTDSSPGTLRLESNVQPINVQYRDEIYDMMVKKGGNTRMMVRFNNAGGYMDNRNETPRHPELFLKDDDWAKKVNITPSKSKWRGYALKDMGNIGTDMYFMDPTENVMEPLGFERILTDASQEETFDSVKPFVLSALDGVPVGIFAYGATASGKTYTMIGDTTNENPEHEGIIPRVVKEVAKNLNIVEAYYEVVEISMSGRDHNTFKYSIFDIAEENRNVFFVPSDRLEGSTGNIIKCTDGVPVDTLDKYKGTMRCPETKTSMVNLDEKDVFKHVVIKTAGTKFDENAFKTRFAEIQTRRRTAKTGGNQSGSSRTHLITTIVCQRKQDNKKCRIYLVDLAGHEFDGGGALANRDDNQQLSTAINESLNNFSSFMKQAQMKGDNKSEKTVTLGNGIGLVGGLPPTKNPLIALTRNIWTAKEGKVMMMACLYPIHQTIQKDNRFLPEMEDPGGGGKKMLGEQEIRGKLKRDKIVIKQLSTIQKDLNPPS